MKITWPGNDGGERRYLETEESRELVITVVVEPPTATRKVAGPSTAPTPKLRLALNRKCDFFGSRWWMRGTSIGSSDVVAGQPQELTLAAPGFLPVRVELTAFSDDRPVAQGAVVLFPRNQARAALLIGLLAAVAVPAVVAPLLWQLHETTFAKAIRWAIGGSYIAAILWALLKERLAATGGPPAFGLAHRLPRTAALTATTLVLAFVLPREALTVVHNQTAHTILVGEKATIGVAATQVEIPADGMVTWTGTSPRTRRYLEHLKVEVKKAHCWDLQDGTSRPHQRSCSARGVTSYLGVPVAVIGCNREEWRFLPHDGEVVEPILNVDMDPTGELWLHPLDETCEPPADARILVKGTTSQRTLRFSAAPQAVGRMVVDLGPAPAPRVLLTVRGTAPKGLLETVVRESGEYEVPDTRHGLSVTVQEDGESTTGELQCPATPNNATLVVSRLPLSQIGLGELVVRAEHSPGVTSSHWLLRDAGLRNPSAWSCLPQQLASTGLISMEILDRHLQEPEGFRMTLPTQLVPRFLQVAIGTENGAVRFGEVQCTTPSGEPVVIGPVATAKAAGATESSSFAVGPADGSWRSQWTRVATWPAISSRAPAWSSPWACWPSSTNVPVNASIGTRAALFAPARQVATLLSAPACFRYSNSLGSPVPTQCRTGCAPPEIRPRGDQLRGCGSIQLCPPSQGCMP